MLPTAFRLGIASVLVAGVASVPVAAAPVGTDVAGLRSWDLRGGEIDLRLNHDLLRQLGVRVELRVAEDRFGRARFPLRGDVLRLEARHAALQAFGTGALTTRSGFVFHVGGRTVEVPWFELVADPASPRSLRLRDAMGRVWWIADRPMHQLDVAAGRLRVPTSDVRIGPALAALLGDPEAIGLVAADLRLDSPASPVGPALAQAKSCAAPEWHGTNGKLTDVRLEFIEVQQVRCRIAGDTTPPLAPCDGPSAGGGADDGEVVFAPSASLRNTDTATTADVPWYEKFQPGTPLPPYGNDQHPILVWNMYRVDADGSIRQIGRSGAKHAWFSSNTDCSDPTCGGGHVLGRACRDVYTTSSNDLTYYLAPRREIAPASGVWGRCGSIWDDVGAGGCDGVQDYDFPPLGEEPYAFRLVVRESQIEQPANAGARWFFEAWYVVRDDVDIHNTMGWLEIVPTWNGTLWAPLPVAGGAFANGAAIDGWVAPGVGANQRNELLATLEGEFKVAVRVTPQGGAWRYDYAVMNLDFAREVVSGAASDPRVSDARGFGAFHVPIQSGTGIQASSFADADLDAANDWTFASAAGEAGFSMPVAGNPLDWGTLYRFTVVANAPPVAGEVRVVPARSGTPVDYRVQSLVPGVPPLFADGFE
jgi:hypothetical protein